MVECAAAQRASGEGGGGMRRDGYIRKIQGNEKLPEIEALGLVVCGGIAVRDGADAAAVIPGVGPAGQDLVLGDEEDLRAMIFDLEDALLSMAFARGGRTGFRYPGEQSQQ